mmetsp:Transcript_25783/g.47135  ORF Transcript_25783/g.47135 Transcript_25783/m.47135 type:complete len:353 (-) Transcript_25783:201-1259(-)
MPPARDCKQVSQPMDPQSDVNPAGKEDGVLMEAKLEALNARVNELQRLLDTGVRTPGEVKALEEGREETTKAPPDKLDAPIHNLAAKVNSWLEELSPWVETETAVINDVKVETKAPVHTCSHSFCIGVYLLLVSAYTFYVFYQFYKTPETRTFESQEADKFGPLDLDITVDCTVCNLHQKQNVTYRIFHEYADGPCQTSERQVIADQASRIPVCNGGSVGVWIGNISEGVERAIVKTTTNGIDIETPLEFWHEKTILFGMTVRRNDEDCESESDCDMTRELYLANMVYDGKVDWGGEHWGGAKLNIGMLQYAQVYTKVPSRTYPDLLSDIGGASGILIFVLGLLRKVSELIF